MPGQGRTLWERLSGQNLPKAVEEQYANPARVKVGGIMTVDTIDLSPYLFTIKEIQQWTQKAVEDKKKREPLTNPVVFTDYILLARPADSEDMEVRIRMIPRENPIGKLTHHVCVLRRFFQCGWDDKDEREGILDAVSEDRDELWWRRGEPDEACFYRIRTKSTYVCSVAVISDLNGDGKVEESEVRSLNFSLWDFHRETVDEAQQKMIEYLFVHYDRDNRMFEAVRGEEIHPERIRTA